MGPAMSAARLPVLALLVAALAGCGAEPATSDRESEVDPATRLALEAPLLVDPGLDAQSRRFAVISDPAPLDGSLPPEDFAPATVAAARSEGLKLSGPPDKSALAEAPCPACTAPTLAQRSAAICNAKFATDLLQATEFPAELPIYPRAHLREAGAGEGACSVQAASFTAPANASEALGFYRAMAGKAGFAIHSARSPTMSALIGKRESDGAKVAVIARARPGGLSEVDLIVSGS